MEVAIRRVGISDLETLMKWRMEVLREVFDIPAGQDVTELERANRSYYQTMLKADGHIACFACLEEIVGGRHLYLSRDAVPRQSLWAVRLLDEYLYPPSVSGAGCG